MRLEKIKLAGFKSFVDPTTVVLPSNLVGVVGPNGCGKSNVIDAVRWVMGESSAKMLRGESMADVIFNGSTGRKPVGLASIELVFDNADGGAGAEFARFNQISVKRQVSRDGQSNYFLNGSRCRRRDIQDLFLGTGLGPRSYAIIEQGMISRIIEARAEDLRLFFEEAAGISKYKERRKETESRMRATRENLERLEDLREEVGKQLLHLERQADTAARYTELKADERRLELELKALRWRSLDDEIAGQDRRIAALETDQEAGVARQRRLEADIEDLRERYAAASEAFNRVQGRFYAVGSEIARAEQAIQFANESRGRSEAELVRLDQELSESTRHLRRDNARLESLAEQLERDEPQLVEAESALSEAVSVVGAAEDQQRAWEGEWDRFNREAAEPASQAQVERARINHLEQRIGRDQERMRRIDDELERLDAGPVEERIQALEAQESGIEARMAAAECERQRVAAELEVQEVESRDLAAELDRLRTGLQQAKGRRASLQALQEAALADDDAGRQAWMSAHGLDATRRLVDGLEVDPGWETAVEAQLGDALRAVLVDDLSRIPVDGMAPGLVLVDRGGDAGRESPPAGSLAGRARSPWPLDGLLGGARTADSLTEALSRRADLASGASLITPEGIRVGTNWLRIPSAAAVGEGVLARAEAMKSLDLEIAALAEGESSASERAAALRESLGACRTRRDAAEQTGAGHNRELAQTRGELTAARSRRDQLAERRAALRGERDDLLAQGEEAIEEIEVARERLHELLETVERLAERREALESQRELLRAAVARGRESERHARSRAQDLRVAVESARAERDASRRSLARAEAQQSLLRERRDALVADLEEAVEPLAEQRARLDEQLGLRVDVEEELAAARAGMESLDAEIREREQERQRAEQETRGAQGDLDALRLERQERLVRRRTLEEQLEEAGITAPALLETLEPEAEEGAWGERLAKLGARIQRLGAINLAAIEEFDEQKQRKVYLDEQHADISRALETLEAAIRKIDRETRGRFKDTYDQVNHGFQQLFPRLFGGGHAYLELTGEDLLETGVTVMARPPGKRNSSIHLLSGGEKALTAVALVFSIFQLNPAPFCMLDEVDAPLDDANVGRFSELVRSMSDQVQFIFISHNKVTMEIAHHLVGVTMHEPGVSRLVSVDMDEAVRLAAVQ
jgi:chromosome segregation protein